MTDKTIIYIRVSTDTQTEESQKKPCIQFCKTRHYNIIDTIADHSKSAYKNVKRPGYNKILELAKKRQIDHIVVWSLDRITRKGVQDLKSVITYLSAYDVQLHSVQEQWIESINMPGGMGELFKDFFIGLAGFLAKSESDRKSERVKNSKKYQKALSKGRVGRPDFPEHTKKEIEKYLLGGRSYRWIHSNVIYKAKHGKFMHPSLGKIAEINKELKK